MILIVIKPTYTTSKMLLLLHLVYFANSATITYGLNPPPSRMINSLATQLDEKYFDDRTVWNIVWSCFATIFACSWVALHPNVPSAKASNPLILGRRLAMMGYMLLAPELVIFWAARQHLSARAIAKRYQG